MLWPGLLVAVIVFVLGAIVAPLFKRQRDPWTVGSSPAALSALRLKKEQVLRMLKDLELEQETGSLSSSEFETLRHKYLTEAALLNRRLRLLEGGAAAPVASTKSEPPSESSPEAPAKGEVAAAPAEAASGAHSEDTDR